MTARAGIVAALIADFSPRRSPDGDVERASDLAPAPLAHRTQPDPRGCGSGTKPQRCGHFSYRFAEACMRLPGHVGRHGNRTGTLRWT